MHLSIFNFVRNSNDVLQIFNTLSRKTININTSILDSIIKNEVDKKLLEHLTKYGFVTDLDPTEEYIKFYKDKEGAFKKRLYICFTVTTLCNLSCDYCFENHIKRKSMSNSTFEKFFILLEDRLKDDNNLQELELVIFGGEPLLNFDMTMKLLIITQELCKKYKINFKNILTTNGLINDENLIMDLHKAGLQKVQITIDGSEKINNSRRKSNKTNVYKTVMNNLEIYNKYFELAIKFNFDKDNISSFTEMLNDITKLNLQKGLHYVKIEAIQITKNDYNEIIHPNTNSIADSYLCLISTLDKFDIKFDFSAVFPTPCMISSPNSFLIDPDGSIYSCISSFSIEEFYLNNIEQINDLNFDTKKFDKKQIVMDHCLKQNCAYLPICETGCALENYYYKTDKQCKKEFYDYFLNKYLERIEMKYEKN